MAVVEVVDVMDGARGEWSIQGGWRFTVPFKVRCDSRRDGPRVALRASPLPYGATYRWPLVGTPTEADPTLFLQSVTVDESDVCDGGGGRIYRLSAVFSAYNPNQDDRGPVDEDGVRDPFAARPQVSGYGEEVIERVWQNRAGQPIVNSAGDPPRDGVPFPTSVLNIEVVKAMRVFEFSWIEELKNHVNASAWRIWPAGSVLCRDVVPRQEWFADAGIYGWVVVFKFAVKPPVEVDDGGDEVTLSPGWAYQLQDAGLRQKVGGKLEWILAENGVAVSEPVNLKADGSAAGPTDDPRYIVVDLLPEADFGVFDAPPFDFPADLFSINTGA